MKLFLFSAAVFFGGFQLANAQYSGPDYTNPQNSSWGNSSQYGYGYDNDDWDDDEYFPDEYYYQLPQDYYNDNLYQSYYNDYRQSINQIRWDRVFTQLNLASWQIQQIVRLNRYFNNYNTWFSYYRYNPDRWYYDRFYALRDILGPDVYIVFQNKYYGGRNPISYWRNYRQQRYNGYSYINPRYRRVSVRNYYIEPQRYHEQYGHSYGLYTPKVNKYDGGGGFKNDSGWGNQNGNNGRFRNNSNNNSSSNSNGVFRNQSSIGNNEITSPNSNDGGFRRTTPPAQRKIESSNEGRGRYNSETRERTRTIQEPRTQPNDSNSSSNGFRNNSNDTNTSTSTQSTNNTNNSGGFR